MPKVSRELFMAYVEGLAEAANRVEGESARIAEMLEHVGGTFNQARAAWQTPSGESFDPLAMWFNGSVHELQEVLREMIHRLRMAHETYEQIEYANFYNLS